MPYAPTLTPYITFAPVPRVLIQFSTMHVDAETATVYRQADGRTYRVRGAINTYAAGGFTWPDTEAPFNVDVEYRAEMFDVDGVSLGFTDPSTTLVPYDGTVIHQPLDSFRNAIVDPLPSFGSSLVRPFNGEMVFPQGRSTGVFIGSGRQGLRGVPLDVATDTLVQADAVDQVFGEHGNPQIPVLCVRTQPKWRLPMPLFVAVTAPVEERLTIQFGGEVIYWRMSGDESAPPVESLATPLLTYADIEAAYADYAALEAAYLTYLALESDYSLAGTG